MTQELVLWVLIAGLIGLLWVWTCSILTKDRRRHLSDDSIKPQDNDQVHSQRKHTVAA